MYRTCGVLSTKVVFLDFEIDNIDIINADISSLGEEWRDKFDTVIMNPPFGTKHNKGLDMVFLQRAIMMSRKAVYSLHKTSTREHILKKAEDWGVRPQGLFFWFVKMKRLTDFDVSVVAELKYDLPNTYKHHKKQSQDIHVDFIRFQKK